MRVAAPAKPALAAPVSAAASEVVATADPPAADCDRHLDEVVRAFFPGWDARSPRVSRASAAPLKAKQG